jgi:acyl transferase domain-containing protein/NAD(P)H-dependent flavin oxidoreductase YrpB (nitropropane dioxygenase family)
MASGWDVVALTPPGDGPAVAVAASRAGALGVLDAAGRAGAPELAPHVAHLRRYGRAGIGLRILADEATALADLDIDSRGLDVVVVVRGVAPVARALDELRSRGSARTLLVAEVHSLDEARSSVAAGAQALLLDGHEAGGWVSADTSFILLQRVVAEELGVPVWVRGGIGLRSAAGCRAAGADAVVLDAQLWLTRESGVPEPVRTAVRRMDGSETVVLGADLGRPLRVLDVRGHEGVETLRALEARLFQEPDRDAARAAWAQEARAVLGLAVESGQAVPLGQDGAFAARLADDWVTVGGVIGAVRDAVGRGVVAAAAARPLAEDGPLARSHGTRYPIVQGPMTRVSDRPELADSVADGGALPFLALALMPGPDVHDLLARTSTLLGDRPWGVGILGFVPDELRAEQLEAVRRHRPPFALIAGGRPDQALALEQEGTVTYLHVPSPALLALFAEQGARRFVLEGQECGGHVGPRSSLVLWDQLLDTLVRSVPSDELADCHVVLAGGIHDARSAAAAVAVSGLALEVGVRVGVLMGTGYLFTDEAVTTGAITPEFQRATLACDETVLLHTGPGHATRCALTPFADDFRAEARRLRQAGVPDEEVHERLERLNLGRLRLAAKAVRRDGAELVDVDAAEQRRAGMFMLGQVATARDRKTTIAALHHDVAVEGQHRLEQAATALGPDRATRPVPDLRSPADDRVAIVGMSCLLPGAEDLTSYWTNILGAVDAVGEVPADRWDWRRYFDPDPATPDRVPSRWGGFLDPVLFDPLEHGIPPASLPSIEPLQLLTLHAVRAAIADAGYADRALPRDRTSVVLGVGGGIADLGQQYALRSGLPMVLDDVPDELLARLPEWTEDSFAGILLNVVAGRVANRLDFGGVNFTVDAACASSLAALHLGARDLQAGGSDVVVVGGADTVQNPFGYLCFAATHALSPSGRCRTFDAGADGIVISEGVAVVVLKRLADAERDGDRVYAVLDGTAGASDGRALGLTAPRPEGQRRAIERAYAAAGVGARDIGLVEAHGTGTSVGDDTELRTLDAIFTEAGTTPGSTVIGSVKSMIGHTKCAAGLAGVVKVALALHHRVLPPTLHVETPHELLDRPESPFRLAVRPRPWLAGDGRARRASVSSFGFGGTNFHAVLSEHDDPFRPEGAAAASTWPAELFCWTAADHDGIRDQVDRLDDAMAEGAEPSLSGLAAATCREARPGAPTVLAVVASSLADLRIKLGLARPALAAAEPWSDPRGVYLGGGRQAGRVAFLYPGQGSQYPGMLEELTLHFSELRDRLEQADRVLADRLPVPLSRTVLPGAAFTPLARADQAGDLTRTAVAQPALGAAGLGVTALLAACGVEPELLSGHSYGEWVALSAAGAFGEDALYRLSEARGRAMAEACPPGRGTMAAVAGHVDDVTSVLDGLPGVWVANVNGPRQTVVSGTADAVAAAVELLAGHGLDATPLNVSAAFHSPLMQPATGPLAAALSQEALIPPRRTVLAGTTAQPYQTLDDVTHELLDQLTSRVRFTDVVEALYDAGARIFVEAGPRQVLTGLVRQVLGDRPHVALAVDEGGGGLVRFLHTVGALAASGVPVRPERLFHGRAVPAVRTDRLVPDTVPTSPSPTAWWVTGGRSRPVHGQAPPAVRPAPPLRPASSTPATPATPATPPATPTPGGPRMTVTPAPHPNADSVMAAHQQLMARFLASHERVMLSYLQGAGVPADAATQAQDAEWFEFDAPEPSSPAALPAAAPAVDVPAVDVPAVDVPVEVAPAAEHRPAPTAPTLPEPRPAPAPTGSEAGSGAPPDSATLTSALIGIIGERTGYPADVVRADTDLQGELGIDSIKKVEILGNFQRSYGFGTPDRPSAMEELSGAKTPREAVDRLMKALGNAAPDPAAPGDGVDAGVGAARFVPVAEAAP